MSARLVWELIDWPAKAFRLFALVIMLYGMVTHAQFSYVYFALAVYLSLTGPSADAFRILGLSEEDWNLQRRIESSVLVALILVFNVAVNPVHWTFLAGYALLAAAVLLRNARMPARKGSPFAAAVKESTGRNEDGWFPATIEGQLVVRPQVRAWTFIVMVAVGSLFLYWGLGQIGPAWPQRVGMLAIIMSVLIFFAYQTTLDDSLRDYVTFGGDRKTWAHYTIVINAVVPMAAIFVGLVVPNWGVVSSLGAAYLMVLAALIVLGLIGRRNWKTTIPILVLSIVIEIVLIYGISKEQYVMPVVIAVVGYAFVGMLLPVMARESNLQAGGLSRWFGLVPAQA